MTAVVALIVVVLTVAGCANEPGLEWDPQSVHIPDVTLPSDECAELAAAVRANAETVQDLLADYEQALMTGTRADVQTAYNALWAMRQPASSTGRDYRHNCHYTDDTADLSRLTNSAIIESYGACVADLRPEGIDCG